ncbi:MAG: YdjY domain-containing protein [Verrucomicrobiales bacterium]
MPARSILLPALAALGLAFASGAEETAPEEPAVAKIGEHRYRLGEIEFDAESREVFVPVTVNMREGGPIEYVLVHENGKIHEAIFTTKVSPMNLQVTMKLLNYASGGGDVFNRLLPPEALEKEGGEASDRGEAVVLSFRPDDSPDEIAVPGMVTDGKTGSPMTAGDWVFTGSKVENGGFMAEREGSIVAIYLDQLAMFNMTREGADVDERWGANGRAIPEIGTRGKLVIRPAGEDLAN